MSQTKVHSFKVRERRLKEMCGANLCHLVPVVMVEVGLKRLLDRCIGGIRIMCRRKG